MLANIPQAQESGVFILFAAEFVAVRGVQNYGMCNAGASCATMLRLPINPP